MLNNVGLLPNTGLEWVFTLLIFLFILFVTNRYQRMKVSKNTKIVKKMDDRIQSYYVLIKDVGIKYFSREEWKHKKFVINKGSFLLSDGIYCKFNFAKEEEIPEKIKLSFGTVYPSLFLFKIPGKFLKLANDRTKKATFRVETIRKKRQKNKTVPSI